jgi:hypothetical protein
MFKSVTGIIAACVIFAILSAVWAFGHVFVSIIGALIVVSCYKSQSSTYTICVGIANLLAFPLGMTFFIIDKLDL